MTYHRDVVRIALPHQGMVLMRKWLCYKGIYFQAGSSSIFIPSRKTKYILSATHTGHQVAREWVSLDGEVVLMSPGEAARTELSRAFPGIKRVGWHRGHTALFDWRPPMFFIGGYRGEAVYTDLKSAYWQIYKHLWLDTGFPCGMGTLPLCGVASRLEDWKQARNSVIGIIRSRDAIAYKGTRVYKLKPKNTFLSPCLWATVQAVLHEIAHTAIESGAIYVATDGFFHPISSGVKWFHLWLNDLGFDFRTNAGELDLNAWGNYKMSPGKETVNYRLYKNQHPTIVNNTSVYDNREPNRLVNWLSLIRRK